MEGIKKDNIINEDNKIIKYNLLKKVIYSKIEQCICKIKQEIRHNGNIDLKTGTGFFCIPSKDIKIFITNKYILNQEFLNTAKKLIIFIEEEKRK